MRLSHLLVMSFFTSVVVWAGHDQAGSKDHPVVSRFPGSYIHKQIATDFDAYTISLSAPTMDTASFAKVKKVELEGKVTRTSYVMPTNASLLAIFRSYEQALTKGGFQILFECKKEACGETHYWDKLHLFTNASFESHQYYLVAKKGADNAATYVVMHTTQNGDGGFIHTEVDVLEEKGLETDLVRTSVASLEHSIQNDGKALVYDIYFDTAKSNVKPESQPAIDAIAQLLNANKFKLYVVGHTDGVGALNTNLDLSKRRADAVVAALIAKGVSKERLVAQGVGPLAPVATNTDDLGRGKNRRVELVPMI